MLVLSRAKGQGLVINGNILVEIVEITSDKVRLGIKCPPEVPVHRREIWEAIQRDNSAAAPAAPAARDE
ncbi:MAG: carbon storage regulator [Pirellulaceae bacterium]|nr:carbon storage regulator [Pirellulaceae bacterium]